MVSLTSSIHIACIVLIGMTPPAYAQQEQNSSMSGSQMQGMSRMQNSKMGGMDMQDMMKRCAQTHQQVNSGKPMSSKMQKMMAQCDQMGNQTKDGQMGEMNMNTPAPDATHSR